MSSLNTKKSSPNIDSSNGNLQRVDDLQRELEELEEWFCSELTRLKHHLGNSSDSNDNDRRSYATDEDDKRDSKFEKLDYEAGYLYTFNCFNTFDGAFRQLSIQISSPAHVPPENESNTISKVLNQMAEMGKEKLMSWLLESMPMTDISTNNIHIQNSDTSSPNNVLEAILSSSIESLRDLVTEGLQIQMGAKEVAKWEQVMIKQARKDEKIRDNDEASVIMVVIIQARDPNRDYEAINEMMIGLIEARYAENGEDEKGFEIMGVYVAGLVARSRNGDVIHNCLWCVSA
ncbi:hypothetical protein RND81_07G084000 [Saponaria officinalis]|uniref:PMI1/PMIR1-2 C-terminal domain-containing protein n=1 Tax=Saponaria officinalis TaxID=3572 RepID=A0AAW1JQC3_SAPOF